MLGGLLTFLLLATSADYLSASLDDELDPESAESVRRVRDREWEVNEDQVVALLESKPVSDHPWPTCCFPRFKPSARFLLLSKRCILQFVVIKVDTTVDDLLSFCALFGWL